MSDMKKYVLDLLNHYHDTERRITMLRYELEHPAFVTGEEMIDALTFRHGEREGSSGGNVSDKTMYTAISYEDKVVSANAEIRDEIVRQLTLLEQKQARLRYYIGLLEETEAEILRLTYIDMRPKEWIAKRLEISPRTYDRRKARAVNDLCDMYAFLARAQKKTGQGEEQ